MQWIESHENWPERVAETLGFPYIVQSLDSAKVRLSYDVFSATFAGFVVFGARAENFHNFYFSFEAKFFSARDTLALIISILHLVLSGDVSGGSRNKSVG